MKDQKTIRFIFFPFYFLLFILVSLENKFPTKDTSREFPHGEKLRNLREGSAGRYEREPLSPPHEAPVAAEPAARQGDARQAAGDAARLREVLEGREGGARGLGTCRPTAS